MTVNVFFAVALALASFLGTATNGLPSIAAVSGGGMQATTNCTYLPAGLRYTAEEAKAISERRKAEWSALGYEARRPYHAGHYFGSWTKGRLWEKHREYFGLTPYGTRGVEMPGFPPWMRTLSKMCVSNEDVVDERIAAWKRAGCPQLLVCGENDGLVGFCRCDKCRALDADLPGEPFLHNKTDRYLDFWNRVCAKARAIRQDVTVCVHAYSLMRHPPRRVRVAYPDNIIFSYVPSYHDADPAGEIAEWKKMGMKHFFFRPNYLCNRTVFPIAREKYIYDVHRIFRDAGGTGDSFDNTPGVAAMGFECYTAVRLCADPDLAFEEIERGWYARYGAAAETARAYHERLRARCDREWAKLLAWLRVNDIEFLDDSHFSRCYHRLHTDDDLKGDLALLESFDDSALDGEAKRRFGDLKLCARHYVLTRQALATRSATDKEALVAFRVAHRDSLGSAWTAHWNKGEFVLWNDTPAKHAYENTGIASFVERFEHAMAEKPPQKLIDELKSPLDDYGYFAVPRLADAHESIRAK